MVWGEVRAEVLVVSSEEAWEAEVQMGKKYSRDVEKLPYV